MKKKTFIFLFFLMVHLFSHSISSHAQYYTNRYLTRGADTAEIYLSCQWYADVNYITWNGIFRSADNGKTLSVQRKTNFMIEGGTIFGDSVAGVLYQIPFIGQDTFGVSFDYGVTFEKRYFNDSYKRAAGCLAGELYISGWGLYRGTDFGNNFTWQSDNDSLQLRDVGTLPGELYSTQHAGYNPLKLAYSNDYGQTFSITEIPLPGILPMYDECDIHRGTEPGELYITVWKNLDSIALFHSFDYGHTLELKNQIHFTSSEMWFTAGRTPGSFYYVHREICGTPPCYHSCIWIYFSRDYGVTFTTYFHNLDSVYTGVSSAQEGLAEPKVFPNPATNRVTFRLGEPLPEKSARVTLYDLFGKPVAEALLPQGASEITMDTQNLAAGIYFYEIALKQYTKKGKIIIIK